MSLAVIDLNADLGEAPEQLTRDVAMVPLFSSLNIAVGGHAGDERTARELLLACKLHGIAAGAHPSYPDRASFGRRSVAISPSELRESLRAQLVWFYELADQLGVPIGHVKPHGALYHDARASVVIAESVAAAVLDAIAEVRGRGPSRLPRLVTAAMPGPNPAAATATQRGHALEVSPAVARWCSLGFEPAFEVFADRAYGSDGSLLPRSQPDAVYSDPMLAARQAVALALHRPIEGSNGHRLTFSAETLCLHTDSGDPSATVAAVRAALSAANVSVRPLRPSPR